MPTIENQSLSKLYYSIGEVAELLQVNASLLRFWEKEFNLSVSKKNKKGNRLYTAKEIEKIQRIYQFVKIEGYTLEGAKKALKTKTEPQIIEQNESAAITSVASSPSTPHASSIDTAALISKLEAIKKRLLSLNLEDSFSAVNEVNEVDEIPNVPTIKPSKPKSEAKPKSSTDAPTLFDF